MEISNNLNQVNFKGVYIKYNKFNEQEHMVLNDISKKLSEISKLDNNGNMTWSSWLKKEKRIDIYIRRTKDTQDMLTVFGIKNARNYYDVKKMKKFFVVGNYQTTDFKPEDVLTAYESQKKPNIVGIGAILFAGLLAIGITLGSSLVKKGINKKVPQKVIQMKDSITDSLKTVRLGQKIVK